MMRQVMHQESLGRIRSSMTVLYSFSGVAGNGLSPHSLAFSLKRITRK